MRQTVRIDAQIPAVIHHKSGVLTRTKTLDISLGGCLIQASDERHKLDPIEAIELQLKFGVTAIPVEHLRSDDNQCRLRFAKMSLMSRRELVRVVLSRADAWIKPERLKDNPLRSLILIVSCLSSLIRQILSNKSDKPVSSPALSAPAKE